MVLKWSLHNH